jgi:[FeFe] hydrogenase H-cluster maturation GTPase HydF
MQTTPASLRLQIGLFGRRNVGKSSLLNALVGQECSIVSARAGTTTDPVLRPMELHDVGPVLFIDTAGIDDAGSLGRLRVNRTLAILERIDLGLLVCDAKRVGRHEREVLAQLQSRSIACLVALNKSDLQPPRPALTAELDKVGVRWLATSALTGEGIDALRAAISQAAPASWCAGPHLLPEWIAAGDQVVLVVPVDKEAPRGRLILPQVQTLREILDRQACALVVQDRQLAAGLARLIRPPNLVVTDSQAFARVAAVTPGTVPLTSFSILMARAKGDLAVLTDGTRHLLALGPEARVLVAEACSHHPIAEDIGRVKIPQALRARLGSRVSFQFVRGHDFPLDLRDVDLVIHCGGCMLGRREVLGRLLRCQRLGIPVTNYGLGRRPDPAARAGPHLQPLPAFVSLLWIAGGQPATEALSPVCRDRARVRPAGPARRFRHPGAPVRRRSRLANRCFGRVGERDQADHWVGGRLEPGRTQPVRPAGLAEGGRGSLPAQVRDLGPGALPASALPGRSRPVQ